LRVLAELKYQDLPIKASEYSHCGTST